MINNQEELRQTANQLAAKGKGLLAVDAVSYTHLTLPTTPYV